MQSIFSSANPILFGACSSKVVGEKLRELGCKKVLVVYDLGIKEAGIADKIVSYINGAGIETVCFDGVVSNPTDWTVEEAGALGVKSEVDGVVGVGGGSSISTAKAAAILLTNPPPITQYAGARGAETNPSKPLVIIPTTAGAGSEATRGTYIIDTKIGVKLSIAGPGCKVSLGIVDPELTLGLPPAVTAITGMDALCHAAEAYTSALSNFFCDLTSREAIRLIGKHLVTAFNDGTNLEAREGMMMAATLGGISQSGPYYHLAHDIGKIIVAKFHIAHGSACAACLPQVLDVIAPAVPDRVRYIAEAFGASIPEDAPNELIGAVAKLTVQELMQTLKIPTLSELGINKKDLLLAVPAGVVALEDSRIARFGRICSPIPVTASLIESIVSNAYDEN